MSSPFVYILYALDDSGEAGEIASAVRNAGWSVCFGHLLEPGADREQSSIERLSAASCVLAVWSANAANSAVLRSDVLEAAQQQKLVLVTLDDAAPIGVGQTIIQLQSLRHGADPRSIASMIAKIEVHAGPLGKRRGRVVPFRARRRPSFPWFAAGAGAGAGVLATSLLGVAWVLFSSGNSLSHPVVESRVKDATAASEVTRDARGLQDQAAMDRWAEISSGDLPAVRAFMRQYEGTWAADEAEQHIRRLEQFAWRGVLGLDDLAAQLDALAAFRADYPDGAHNSEAITLENRRRETLEMIGRNLVSLGYVPVAEGDDLETIRVGVETFERSARLKPTGRITENVAGLISAAAAGKDGAHSRQP